MQIPKTVKIGGLIYDVTITDNLQGGSAVCTAEINYRDLTIRVCPSARARMESSFLHEVVHGIADCMGFVDHDERLVDALAQQLYQLVTSNPEMFLPDNAVLVDAPTADEKRRV